MWVSTGKGRKGDASFVSNTIKGSLTCQKTCLLPLSSGNTAKSIWEQCAA
jgi:hypothetical protein